MKPTLPFILLSFLLASCSSYQYIALDSQTLQRNEKNEFIAENDSIRVVYNFNGPGCPVKLTIYNKTDQPMDVEWQKSAMLLNDSTHSYYSPDFRIAAATSGTSYHYGYDGTIYGDAKGNEQLSFIPPRSSISRTPATLQVRYPNTYEFEQIKTQVLKTDDLTDVLYKEIQFDREKSPILLRSYLTFKIDGTNKEFTAEHQFYVSDVWHTHVNPNTFDKKQGNRFYVKE